MTVSSAENRVQYAGDGAVGAFPVTFGFQTNSHIKVILTVDSTGIETTQTETTHYTLTGAGQESTGGTVTMITEPASGETLTIKRNVPQTQETDYVANSDFPESSHEAALDKLTHMIQELEEVIGRGLTFKETSAISNKTIDDPVALQFLRWNSDVSSIEPVNLSSIGTTITLPSSSTTDNVVTFEDATGLAFKDSGIGIASLVTLTGAETLTNKTLTTPTIGSFANAAHNHENAAGGAKLDHGDALTGITDDDHTQYGLLAGRAGGTTYIGGTASTDDLIFQTTSGVGASGADMIFKGGNDGATEFARFLNSGNFGIGTASPDQLLHIASTSPNSQWLRFELNAAAIADTESYGGIEWEGQDTGGTGVRAKIEVVASGTAGHTTMNFNTAEAGASLAKRMMIDDQGRIGVGNLAGPLNQRFANVASLATNQDAAGIYWNTATASKYTMTLRNGDNTTPQVLNLRIGLNSPSTSIHFLDAMQDNGTIIGAIRGDGAGGAAYANLSDERKKHSFEPTDGEKEAELMRCVPVEWFTWQESGKRRLGWSAQKLHKILPDSVCVGEGDKDWMVMDSKLIPYLTAFTQNIDKRLTEIERKLR